MCGPRFTKMSEDCLISICDLLEIDIKNQSVRKLTITLETGSPLVVESDFYLLNKDKRN